MDISKKKELLHLLHSFLEGKKEYHFKPLTSGYINDTFLVLENNIPLYVLQRINDKIFKNVDGVMGNIENALTYLDSPDYKKIVLIPSLSGKNHHIENGYWRLMSYIDDSTTYDITNDKKIAFEAGRIIGEFHQLLQKADMDNFVDTIPKFHSIELRKDEFEEALLKADGDRIETAKKPILFAEQTLMELESLNSIELPYRICHNDTKLNNILFSKKDGSALCMIDLDTLMKGYFYYDFGDAVRTIANPTSEDEKELEKITFRKPLFESFVDGLASKGAFLTQKELESLPLGVVYMPFIHGLRALTDYLNNNIYYKISYDNQNLDRCASLFDFSKKALEKRSYMEDIIFSTMKSISS